MKIIRPKVYVDFEGLSGHAILEKIDTCGRTCYRSEQKNQSPESFVRKLIMRGHESVLEHVSITAYITCDRGVTHELVRHRLASYSQESTRYCNYAGDKFGRDIRIIEPCYLDKESAAYYWWQSACKYAENCYLTLIDMGRSAQEARAVLPHSTAADIVMTTNLREWRHFLKLRTSKASHPQMREIANMILLQMKEHLLVVFEDINIVEE